MDTSNMSPSAGGAIPARLGLPRRSSFDPLSTSNKSGLSLGSLPGPSFGALPSGLRSVPALDSSRPFGNGALRNVSAPLGDGQRTPGGSLVVGAEVFGFGKHAPRDSSERRRGAGAAAAAAAAGPAAVAAAKDSLTTSGSVDGLDDVLSATGSARLATGGGAWRGTDFVRQSASSTDDLRLRSTADDARFRKGLDRLSADFAAAGGHFSGLRTTGSAYDLRSSSPVSMSDILRTSSRSSLVPPSAHAAQSAADASSRSREVSPTSAATAAAAAAAPGGGGAFNDATTPTGAPPQPTATSTISPSVYAAAAEAISSPDSGPYTYPYQPPDPSPPPLGNPYFMGAVSPSSQPGYPHPQSHLDRPPMPNAGMYASFGQVSSASANATEEDLSNAMRGMNLANGAGGVNGIPAGPNGLQRGQQYSPEPYGGPRNGGREMPARQDSSSFQPYYLGGPAPYMTHPGDMYAANGGMPYGQAGYYAATAQGAGPTANGDAPGGAPGIGRRDSITPQWALPMPPFALAPDFVGPHSRPGSFSFGSPAGIMPPQQGYAPNAAAGSATPTGGHSRQPGSGGGSAAGDDPAQYAPHGVPAMMAQQQQHQQPMHHPGHPSGPQLGQQHHIILGRGVRGQEYVAPGPMHAPPYGMGYGAPDLRQLKSPLLQEFRNNRNRNWELQDLMGHISEFSGDQLGSRHIQNKLDSASLEEKAMVFNEILPNMLQLSTDLFANYVIQKFFEQGSQIQKTAMANVLEGHVLQLSLQMYGCRVVQKALEYVLVDQQVRLVKELDGHVLKCARDAQSNHVIQRALERVPPEHLAFITTACVGQVRDLATHPYGCRVLQRIFENCPPSQTRPLLDELLRVVQDLVEDQYGNYVIQWVIEKGEASDRSAVVAKLYGQVLPLAQQKYASNVVEKCIKHGSDEERRRLIDEVLKTSPDGSSIIKAMLTHPYANYVMQKCLDHAKGAQRDALYAETANQLTVLRRYQPTPSKHLTAIEKVLASERMRKGLPPLQFPSPAPPHQVPNGGHY